MYVTTRGAPLLYRISLITWYQYYRLPFVKVGHTHSIRLLNGYADSYVNPVCKILYCVYLHRKHAA